VVSTYPSEKWSSSVGSIPNIWKVIKFIFQIINQSIYDGSFLEVSSEKCSKAEYFFICCPGLIYI
jgi:hypothetical protein